MSTEPEAPTTPEPIDLGDGRTVIFDEPADTFYRVRMPSGEVQAFPARGEATPENALADLVTDPPAPPPPVVVLTPLTVISRLTDAEKLAILTSTDPQVVIWRTMAVAAQEVRSDDPRTAEGFALLVSKGLLASDRPAQLLAP